MSGPERFDSEALLSIIRQYRDETNPGRVLALWSRIQTDVIDAARAAAPPVEPRNAAAELVPYTDEEVAEIKASMLPNAAPYLWRIVRRLITTLENVKSAASPEPTPGLLEALDITARRLHKMSGAPSSFEDCPAEWCVEARAALDASPAPEPTGLDAILPTFEVGQVVGDLQPGRRRHDWCSIHGDIGPAESIDAHARSAHGSGAEAIRKARKVLSRAARLKEPTE